METVWAPTNPSQAVGFRDVSRTIVVCGRLSRTGTRLALAAGPIRGLGSSPSVRLTRFLRDLWVPSMSHDKLGARLVPCVMASLTGVPRISDRMSYGRLHRSIAKTNGGSGAHHYLHVRTCVARLLS